MNFDLKKVIVLGFVLSIVVILISIGYTFRELKPFTDSLFDNANNLENNQELTRTEVFLIDLNYGSSISLKFESKDELTLHFWSADNSLSVSEIALLNKRFKTNKTKNLFFISTDSLNDQLSNIKFPLFYISKEKLPFRYKEIIYPYTVVIKNNQIAEAYIGKLR